MTRLGYNVFDALFDKRKQVINPRVFPWSMHGYLQCSFSDGMIQRGTGTLISGDSVLTAGHCLYNHLGTTDEGRIPVNVTFYMGMQNNRYALKIDAQKVFIHPAYQEGNDENFDIGIVKLDQDVGDYTEYATLKSLPDAEISSLKINITGYPSHVKPFDVWRQKPTYNLYTMEGFVKKVTKHKLYYDIDTSGGQSGAGVWSLDTGGNVFLTGVHVTGSKLEGNGAVRINKETLSDILHWLK